MSDTKYYFLEDLEGMFSAPESVEGGSLSDRVKLTESGPEVIYEIYDDLAQRFPDYVKKTLRGEAFGYPIDQYTFANFAMENRTTLANRRFKLLITTSIHGYEQGCAWTAAQFFRLLCEGADDPILGFLRRNVVFEVIPVCNPSGFAKNSRTNDNGIDLNRNFNANFQVPVEPGHSYYGGAEPATEVETRLLSRFLEENTDAEYVIDYHNIAKGYPLYYVQYEDVLPLANSVFTALTHKWTKEYPELPRDQILGYVKPSANTGMYVSYAQKLGLNVFTVETPWCMPVLGKEQYDKPTIRCGMEVFVNTIVAILKSYR